MYLNGISKVMLNNVVATGAGMPCMAGGFRAFTFYVTAADVTSGGTMKIEAQAAHGAWVEIDSRAITANGSYVVALESPLTNIRANLSARTDGTYNVSVDMSE